MPTPIARRPPEPKGCVMIQVPKELAASHDTFYPESGREWIAKLPALAASYLERWELTLDGEPMHGMVGLVLPVLRADGTPAALKLQPIDEEHLGEGTALRVWDGQGAARLLADAEEANSSMLLLERLDEDRPLSALPDITQALQVIGELLVRLNAHQAPPEIRRLSDVINKMLEYLPQALTVLTDPDERRMMQTWADVVRDVAEEPGDRLLHWDLHYDNVLAAEREPWLAIDPKPLAGDPGFELLPALHNRWEEIVHTGDVARAVRRRFDQMTEVLELDRQRATGWSIARVLQNSLWDVEDGRPLNDVQIAIAKSLL